MAMKAVLVGVDEYERPDIRSLSGCVNDVVLVRRILKQYFGFGNEDIRVVVNQRATKASILHRLGAMVEDAEAGDVLVFYFSGHGSQLRQRAGDTLTDFVDEVLCPYDMDWDQGSYILHEDIDSIFGELHPDVLLEAFFDCCFWGAGARELSAVPEAQALRPDVRYLPPPLDIAARAEGDQEWLDYHRFSQCHCFAENVVWAATEEGQLSAEDFLGGRAHGIFTYSACRFIELNIERLVRLEYSRDQLLEDLLAYLHSLGYEQRPDLAAPTELRAAEPLATGVGWGAWAEAARHARSWSNNPGHPGWS